MSAPIDFYFDFSSPYGYFASERIDALADRHGRAVMWHAIVLDAQFQPQGGVKIPAALMRSEYVKRDTERTAAFLGIPYKEPAHYPVHTEHAARAFLWLNDRNPQLARDFGHAAYRALFVNDRNIYVTANFKETQMQHLTVGEKVDLTVDAYPNKPITGQVESFAGATGAKFSLLPPDNATGNFVKVVQRVPVRIALNTDSSFRRLLRPGMSVKVVVHTK